MDNSRRRRHHKSRHWWHSGLLLIGAAAASVTASVTLVSAAYTTAAAELTTNTQHLSIYRSADDGTPLPSGTTIDFKDVQNGLGCHPTEEGLEDVATKWSLNGGTRFEEWSSLKPSLSQTSTGDLIECFGSVAGGAVYYAFVYLANKSGVKEVGKHELNDDYDSPLRIGVSSSEVSEESDLEITCDHLNVESGNSSANRSENGDHSEDGETFQLKLIKDGKEASGSQVDEQIRSHGSNTYRLYDVQPADAGVYGCMAVNRYSHLTFFLLKHLVKE